MKLTKILIALLLAFTLVFCFAACDSDDSDTSDDDDIEEGGGNEGGGNEGGGNEGGGNEGGGNEGGGETTQLKDITGVTFGNQTYNYDGTEKQIVVSGTLPSGVTVAYTNNKGTDANTYNATAVLSGEGYKTLTLNATLTINKINMTGLSLGGATHTYDGSAHSITLNGSVPAGSTVTYTGGENGQNSATNAGSYNITVTVTNKNYNTFTASATLNIGKLTMQGLTFSGASFPYDTELHKITVTGNVPGGATVTYSGGQDGKNGATDVGDYTITVTVTHQNYNTYTATAVLKITTTEEPLSVSFLDESVYFQNSLDNKYLYSYDGTSPEYVGRDKPTSMITVGDKMYYISKSLFTSGIFSFDPSTNKSECLYEVSSADVLISDGTYLYYNVNKLVGGSDTNGIYRLKIADLENTDAEVTATRLTSVKSGDMTVCEGYVYFSNKADGGKLYAVSVSASNATPTKIYDYKVSDLISDGTKIYFVREITLSNLTPGAAIYSINVSGGLNTLQNDDSSKVIKITMSKGKYLTIIGDYVYFLNTDMVTSTIFGDGIYRAKKDGSGWVGDILTNLIGATKVVDGTDDKLFGLTTDGDALYYYRANSKHLYMYDLSAGDETDLMAGFVPPERTELILTYYEKAVEYNGEIYYINMKDGGKLYKYNPTTQLDVRLTNLAVADLAINDGVLYYSTTRLLVNFDLYRMNLTTGALELLSTEKCKNFSFYNGKLYYTCFSGANTLNCMDLTTLQVTKLFGKDIVSGGKSVDDGLTTVYNGKLYFVANDLLYSYDLTTGASAVVNSNLKPLEYIIHNGKILMMNCDGLQNNITVYDIAADKVHKIGNIGLSGMSDDLRGMFVYNNEMYFYRNVALGSDDKGLYKVVPDGNSYKAVLVDKIEGYYMCESMVIGNKVYFLDVWQVKDSLPTTASSAKLCVLDMTTKQVTVLN